jgi:hypothetical protein
MAQSHLISLRDKGCGTSFPPFSSFPPFFSEAFSVGGDGEENGGGNCQVDRAGTFSRLV